MNSLWSLLDMLRFYADRFVRLVDRTAEMKGLLRGRDSEETVDGFYQVKVVTLAKAIAEDATEIGLTLTAKKCGRMVELLEKQKTYVGRVLRDISDVHERVFDELEDRYSLMLTQEEARFFDPTEPLFGREVAEKLPECIEDISEAGKCFAVGRYTASVFHLMRALERGVQRLGLELGVEIENPDGQPLSWGDIENRIWPKIDALKKSDPRKRKFAEARTYCRDTRWAFRNDTMHPRATYSGEQAERVFGSARSFFGVLTELV